MADLTNLPGETITTVEGLEALPSGTILRGSAGQVYLILMGCIYGAGNDRSMAYAEVRFGLPMTVLYRPDVDPKPIAEAIAEDGGHIIDFTKIDERDPETWAALPAGELKKRISDEHGEDLTYFGPGWRCVCGMVLGGDLVEHVIEVAEVEIYDLVVDGLRAKFGVTNRAAAYIERELRHV